jgi:hypothetical protein
MTSLSEIVEAAKTEASRRGFRSLGIYHLLWAVHKLDPDTMNDWLDRYQVEKDHFIKMLENILRPRRAGGGVPRDKQDATLAEEALLKSAHLAESKEQQPDASHLGQILKDIEEDPVASLCERFGLAYRAPKG